MKVSNRTMPAITALPEKFRIVHQVLSDPTAELLNLPEHPPDNMQGRNRLPERTEEMLIDRYLYKERYDTEIAKSKKANLPKTITMRNIASHYIFPSKFNCSLEYKRSIDQRNDNSKTKVKKIEDVNNIFRYPEKPINFPTEDSKPFFDPLARFVLSSLK